MVTGDEKWKFYKAYKGVLPNEAELRKLKVLILPGSANDAYDPSL